MSKAFTREDDSVEAEPIALPARSPLPPGVKNYVTPAGVARLRKSLEDLIEKRRSEASNADSTDNAQPTHALRKFDTQITQLQEILSTVVVTEPPGTEQDQIRFGAKVTVEDQKKEKDVYQVVGVDETDLDAGRISWLSPLARALHLHRAGEVVRFRTPVGIRELKILSVEYD
jgi:transcription elongation factor GreB